MKNDGDIHEPFHWRGMMWDLLCKRVNAKYIGIYVGYNCEDVNVNFSVRLKVTFSLVDSDKESYPVPPKGQCLSCSSSQTVSARNLHL